MARTPPICNIDVKLICRLKSSVAVDLSQFGNTSPSFTKAWVMAGKPHIIEKELREEYCVVLYDKECGILDSQSSKVLHALTKLSTLSVKTQAYVGVDLQVKGHCLVVVNVLAPPGLAQMVVSTIVSNYGSKWSNYLIISNQFSKDCHIGKILWDSTLKLPPQDDNKNKNKKISNKSHSTSVIETARKRIKLNNSSSLGDISSSSIISHEKTTVDLTSFARYGCNEKRYPLNKPIVSMDNINDSSRRSTDKIQDKPIYIHDKTNKIVSLSSSHGSQCVHVPVINQAPHRTEKSNLSNSDSDSESNSEIETDTFKPPDKNGIQNTDINGCISSLIARTCTTVLPTDVHMGVKNNISSLQIHPTTGVCTDDALGECHPRMQYTHAISTALHKIPYSLEKENIADISKLSFISKLNLPQHDPPVSVIYNTVINYVKGTEHSDSKTVINSDMKPKTNISSTVSTIPFQIPRIDTNGATSSRELLSIKQEPSSQKTIISSGISINSVNSDISTPGQDLHTELSQCSSINGSASDLPENIKRKLQVIDQESSRIDLRRNNKDDDGLPNLMDERGTSTICQFLLRKTPDTSNVHQNSNDIPSTSTDNQDDDDELSFPVDFLARHKKKHLNPLNDDDDVPGDKTNEGSGAMNVITVPDDNEPVVVKDAFDEIFDSMSEFPKNVEVKPCRAIQRIMLPHQKVALNWMLLRENNSELPPFWECIQEGSDYFNLGTRRRIFERPKSVKGGILADDMGLGKTLTTIALILTNHIGGKTLMQHKNVLPLNASEICDDLAVPPKKRKSVKVSTTEKKDLKKPGFLFRQMYLEKITRKKKNTPEKAKKDEPMFSSDMDDNNDVAVDSIINNLSAASKDSLSSPKFGEDDKKRKATLIVCPMSVLSNWTDQFKEHVVPSLNLQIYLYYGPERIRDLNYLKKHDIIITTYGTLTCDYRAVKQKGKLAPLHSINWLRIVLDEGHIIRNFRSQQAIAAGALNASRRWILTGTVIQNRMTDLWAMVKFLHIEPFSDRKWWNKHVAKSLERRAAPGEIYFNRIQKIVKHIAIRRLKTDEINGKPLVQLPKREVVTKWINFSEEERKVYDGMQKDGKFIVSKYFRMNTVFKNYANILVIIMRLRQLCCHPKLCTKAIEKLDQARNIMDNLKEKIDDINLLDSDLNDEMNAISEEDRQKLVSQIMVFLASSDSEECAICLEILRDPVITRCAHIYCSTCINEVIESSDGNAPCPLCRSDIDQNTLLNVPLEDKTEKDKSLAAEENVDEEWQSSAKIDSLMESLTDLQREEPDVKSLVVSQFTSFLDIVEKPLKDAGIQFCRLDGTMSQAERVKVMDDFKETDGISPTVMLLSLTAGGVGLNLVSASRVFLLDPAWNPAVEEQCFDRCHRLGQTRDVKVYKFIVKDSVEDRMLILQEKKRLLMKKAFGGMKQNAEQRRQAALQDISTLLDLNLPVRNIPPP